MEKIKSTTKAPLTALVKTFDAFGVLALKSRGRKFDQYDNLINLHKGEAHFTTSKTYSKIKGKSGNWWIPHPDCRAGRWDEVLIQELIDLIPNELTQE